MNLQFRPARARLTQAQHFKCRDQMRKLRPGHGFNQTQYAHDKDNGHLYARHPVFSRLLRFNHATLALEGYFDRITGDFEPIGQYSHKTVEAPKPAKKARKPRSDKGKPRAKKPKTIAERLRGSIFGPQNTGSAGA